MADKKIFIVTGEASGDLHAANLVKDIHKINPDIKFYGMGGVNMRQAGVNIIVDTKDLAVIGIFDVLLNIRKIYKAQKTIRQVLRANPPDLLILIDYSGFNLRLAKIAKKMGLKILYYISPQLWASRTNRVKIMRKYVDHIAVIFPFEVEFYKKFNIPVSFVGHPLVDKVKPTMSAPAAKKEFNLNPDYKTIGLFPGSRKGEIKRLLPVMLKAAQLIKTHFPNTQFILPLAPSLSQNNLEPFLNASSSRGASMSSRGLTAGSIKIISQQNYDVMHVCDAIIAKSGTVTLEIALMGIPMVIIYKIWPPYFPIKSIIKIPYIGMCNIVAGKEIAKELLQQHATPKNISQEIIHILNDDQYRNNMINELHKIKNKLTGGSPTNLPQLILKNL